MNATMENLLMKCSGANKLQKQYEEFRGLPLAEFLNQVLRNLEVGVKIDREQLQQQLGEEGQSLLICSNHPYGGLDGMVLLREALACRKDIKILANPVLSQFGEMEDVLISIDPYAKDHRGNARALRQARTHLNEGGALLIFPAGEVSSWNWKSHSVRDCAWHDSAALLAQHSLADVLPLYVEGHNSLLFQGLGCIHPSLRTVMLPRELMLRGRQMEVRCGQRIKNRLLRQFHQKRELTGFLRQRSEILSQLENEQEFPIETKDNKLEISNTQEELVAEVAAEILRKELESLPNDCLLLNQGKLRVYCLRANQAPLAMRELGRLRELTFRAEGEGTGKAFDLDQWDDHYMQILVYDVQNNLICGGTRFCPIDEALKDKGREGLYTSLFYKFRGKDLKRVQQSGMEIGRTFVRPEYQRRSSSLLLIWRGLGLWLKDNPQYRYLFGVVSVSAEFPVNCRALLASTLPDETISLKPRRRFRLHFPHLAINEAREELRAEVINDTFRSLDPAGRDMPVLVKTYMKMGGRFFGFSEDPDFAHSLDGLVMVDLHQLAPKQLKLYFGAAGDEYLEKQLELGIRH